MSTITPVGMMLFPHLFEARPRLEGQKPVHSVRLLFDEEAQKTAEWAAIKKAVAAAIEKRWGADAVKDKDFLAKLHMPWRPAEEKPKYPGFTRGKVFINPWSDPTKNRVGVVDGKNQPITNPVMVWGGQLARVSVAALAYPLPGKPIGNQGVLFLLNNVQIVKADMPRLDGKKGAAEEFGEYGGGDDTSEESPF